jgi:hypothetical protein
MGHLTTETLGRLVSEEPSPDERRHLDTCPFCRSELEAMREQTEAVGALPDLRPPAGDWEALEARLVSEGLIRSSGLALHSAGWWSTRWMQAAAALVLFLGGAALGSRLLGPGSGLGPAEGQGPPGIQLIPVGSQAQPVSSLADAAEAVRLAEQEYVLALLQYRQLLDAQGEPGVIGDPASRFAALEAIVAAGRAAVQQAPTDPFVNGVLVGALAEREALLRTAASTPGIGVF